MAGLVPDLSVAIIQAPFLCELDRAAELSITEPYSLLTQHFADRPWETTTAIDTLRYFDGVNHAKRANAPALLSAGLRDGITPPATVLPAFTALRAKSRPCSGPTTAMRRDANLTMRTPPSTPHCTFLDPRPSRFCAREEWLRHCRAGDVDVRRARRGRTRGVQHSDRSCSFATRFPRRYALGCPGHGSRLRMGIHLFSMMESSETRRKQGPARRGARSSARIIVSGRHLWRRTHNETQPEPTTGASRTEWPNEP